MLSCITQIVIWVLFLLIQPAYCSGLVSKVGSSICSVVVSGANKSQGLIGKLYESNEVDLYTSSVGIKGYGCCSWDWHQLDNLCVRSIGLNCFVTARTIKLGSNIYYGNKHSYYGVYIDNQGYIFGCECLLRLHCGVLSKYTIDSITQKVNIEKISNCPQVAGDVTLKFFNVYMKNSWGFTYCNVTPVDNRVLLYGVCIFCVNIFDHVTLECGGMMFLDKYQIDFNGWVCVGIYTSVVDIMDGQISDWDSVEDIILYQDLWS